MQLRFILSLIFSLAFTACASGPRSADNGQEIEIRLKGVSGALSETRYANRSHILTYADGQLVRDRNEAVDFVVANEIMQGDPRSDMITFYSTTVAKDGPVALHDLAFPEKNETIDYVVKETGEILKAGPFPQSSIFFVPAVPIPKDRVKVGDTWSLEHVWRSSRDGVPLRLEILAILKDIVKCEGTKQCADLEISGHVNLVLPPDAADARFSSKVWGRMLFSLDRGDVLWSQTRSLEDMSHSKGRILVSSCMTSELKSGGGYRAPKGCDPVEQAVTKIPSL